MALLLVALGLGVFLGLAGEDWRDAVAERKAKTERKFEMTGREFESDDAMRFAVTKTIKVEQWVQTGLYRAAQFNLILSLALFFIRPWWCGREVKAAAARKAVTSRGGRGKFWLWVGAAVLLALVLRWPRMELSLYNDEVYNFRQYIHGKIKTNSAGVERFERASWLETMWENKANNGVLFSALARICDEAWRPGDGSTDGQINERALRWPALVPGLLSIAAIAMLGRSLFGGAAGCAAAFLMALHPWHLRYSTEARAYGLVILFVALAMLCLVMALRGNRWRWWLGFAGCQFLYMYAFAGALHFALGLNLVAFVTIIMRGKQWRHAALGRLVVASLMSAMLYLQLMAPCLPQMAYTLSALDSLQGNMSVARVVDITSYLTVGMPVFDHDPSNLSNPALAKFWPSGWWMLVPALAGLGLWCFFAFLVFTRRGLPAMLLAGNALAFVSAIVASVIGGTVMHYWYAIYLLPFTVLALAAGWAVVWKTKRLRYLAYALPLMIALIVWRPLRDYRNQSKEGLREAVTIAREGGAMLAGFWSDSSAYALDMRIVGGAEDLRRYAAEAAAQGRDLAVIFGHHEMAEGGMKECLELAKGESDLKFRHVATLPGLEEPQFTTFVYRLSWVR